MSNLYNKFKTTFQPFLYLLPSEHDIVKPAIFAIYKRTDNKKSYFISDEHFNSNEKINRLSFLFAVNLNRNLPTNKNLK